MTGWQHSSGYPTSPWALNPALADSYRWRALDHLLIGDSSLPTISNIKYQTLYREIIYFQRLFFKEK
jgi:hypothetical protein